MRWFLMIWAKTFGPTEAVALRVGLAFVLALSPACDKKAAAIEEAKRQYNMTKMSRDKMDICVHAGRVAEAVLQTDDISLYLAWKAREQQDCEAAGVPRR